MFEWICFDIENFFISIVAAISISGGAAGEVA